MTKFRYRVLVGNQAVIVDAENDSLTAYEKALENAGIQAAHVSATMVLGAVK